jgi:hypothetical protein
MVAVSFIPEITSWLMQAGHWSGVVYGSWLGFTLYEAGGPQH